jgi:hypothetical protein
VVSSVAVCVVEQERAEEWRDAEDGGFIVSILHINTVSRVTYPWRGTRGGTKGVDTVPPAQAAIARGCGTARRYSRARLPLRRMAQASFFSPLRAEVYLHLNSWAGVQTTRVLCRSCDIIFVFAMSGHRTTASSFQSAAISQPAYAFLSRLVLALSIGWAWTR